MRTKNIYKITILLLLSFFIVSCATKNTENTETESKIVVENNNDEEISTEVSDKEELSTEESEKEELYPDWTEETHSNDGDLDYDTVFPQNEVNRIDIVIDDENWEAMMADMTSIYGEFGGSSSGGSKGGGGDLDSDSTEKPSYVESQVYFNGTQWYNVGIKYKGHSSLKSSWNSGNYKMPFKLDFDEYEDEYEELKNQRFYGFKKLAFSPNFNDDSFLHEKLATEVFDDAGLVVPDTAYYAVYLDHGDGPMYYGLYTAVEVIDDTVIEKFGDDDSGNVYEAEGDGVTLAPDTYDMITEHFEKKNNEEEADWSDVQELSQVLNSDLRTTDTDTWKENLEEIFDVDVFLKWLAVNSTIQNWDTYGIMTHNFYLYNNPDTGKLTWIPRDNNESFSQGKQGIVTLNANGVSDERPLIRYLIDDEDYREQYVEYVHEFTQDVLDTDELTERINELHDMIEPYIVGDDGELDGYTHLKNDSSFTNSVSTLLSFIEGRISAALAVSLDDDWTYSETSSQMGGRSIGGGGMMRPGMIDTGEIPEMGEMPEGFEEGEMGEMQMGGMGGMGGMGRRPF